VVELQGAGSELELSGVDPSEDAPSPGAPTDTEVRTELREARRSLISFREYLNTTAFLRTGPRARVLPDGTAVAPEGAPEPVRRVILAANLIAKFPYKWSGGHGAWRDNGYDCSGSVSFALAGAGLLDRPLPSAYSRATGVRARAAGSPFTPTAATCS
jgi:cell wall-associated NlpC family hydrolase